MPSERSGHNKKRKSPRGANAGSLPRDSVSRGGLRDNQAAIVATTLRARKRTDEDAWELVHPRCARDRQEDLQEVRKMLAAGEVDVAVDECRWLLAGCHDCMEAHRILGEIAMADNDLALARAHFGYAYRLGVQALQRSGGHGPLPYRLPANQSFFEASKALAWCLVKLGKAQMAVEVIETLLRCDPTDPLDLRRLLDEGAAGGSDHAR